MKRLYLFFFLILLSSAWLQGQAEALRSQLDQAKGTDKVDILYQLSQSTDNIKEGREYAEEAFDLSREIGYQKGIYESAYQLTPFLLASGQANKAIKHMEAGIAAAQSARAYEAALLGLRRLQRIVRLHGNKKQLASTELEIKKLENLMTRQQQASEIARLQKDYQNKEEALLQSRGANEDIAEQLKLTEEERALQDAALERLAREKAELEVKTLQLRTDSLQQSLEIQKKQQEVQQYDAQLRQQRLWLLLSVAGLLAAVIILFLLLINYQLKRKRAEEKSQLQQQLMRQEKLASLGQLTAGIAHEIKNPLNFINNFAQVTSELADELYERIKQNLSALPAEIYEDALEAADSIRENTNDILDNGQRADRIVNTMMLHTRSDKGLKQAAGLNQLLEDSLDMAYSAYKAKDATFSITINKDLEASLPPVKLAVQGMNRVFLNLFTNACYALNKKKQQAGDDYRATLDISSRKIGNQVEIKISDNGIGIPKEIQQDIFTPFFTTKPTGSGNVGLGLSISHDVIVQEHQGTLEVASEEGKFTTFTIKLPIEG